jgi:hypothetical protein
MFYLVRFITASKRKLKEDKQKRVRARKRASSNAAAYGLRPASSIRRRCKKGTSSPLGEFSRYRSLETSTSIITLRDQFGRSDL